MINKDIIANWFTYHVPTGKQTERYNALREGAFDFAMILLQTTSPSADQTAAFRKLRECVMTANASIALEDQGENNS